MENYINNYNNFNKIFIYDFKVGNGGIGDYITAFMIILTYCMDNNIKLYKKINNIEIEKYIKLNYDCLNYTTDQISNLRKFEIKTPDQYYNDKRHNDKWHYNYNVNINEVFYFDDVIKMNVKNILPFSINEYISIHLRLGDKYLECDNKYIKKKKDVRTFSEEKLYKFIEDNYEKNIIFFCDNNEYKLKIKNKYNNITITNGEIGHTSLVNTTTKQTLDTVTEFYLLTNSQLIYAASQSGFNIIASKFKNIKLET